MWKNNILQVPTTTKSFYIFYIYTKYKNHAAPKKRPSKFPWTSCHTYMLVRHGKVKYWRVHHWQCIGSCATGASHFTCTVKQLVLILFPDCYSWAQDHVAKCIKLLIYFNWWPAGSSTFQLRYRMKETVNLYHQPLDQVHFAVCKMHLILSLIVTDHCTAHCFIITPHQRQDVYFQGIP